MGCRVKPGNDRKEAHLPRLAVMAGRKTRPSTLGEQPHVAVTPGLSPRTPGSKSHVFRRLINLYADEICGVWCPMRWKRLVGREASSAFQWSRLAKKPRMAARKSARLG
jgi:hypothetical protein